MAVSSLDKVVRSAREAYQKGNHDYCITLFQQALALDPDAVEARKELRAVARKRAQGNEGFGTKMKALLPMLKLRLLKMRKNYDAMVPLCEKILALLPNHLGTLKSLGIAAAESQLDKTVPWIFEDVLSKAPADKDALRHLARFYYEDDEQKATGYYQRILAVDNSDKEAHEGVRDLAARATMKKSVESSAASGQQDSWKQMVKDTDTSRKLEFGAKVLKTKDDFDQAITYARQEAETKPDDPRRWTTIGDLCLQAKRFGEAEEAFGKAAALEPANATHRFKIGDSKLRRLETRIAELQEQAKGGNAQATEEVKRVTAEYLGFAVQDYAVRVQSHPTDLELRYRYGDFLLRAGKAKEAAGEFQLAVRNPKRHRAAMARLADCFERMGNDDLALAQLRKVLEEYDSVDDDSKPVIYRLGRIEERLGHLAEAHTQYIKIFEVDMNYRDVSERVSRTKPKEGSA